MNLIFLIYRFVGGIPFFISNILPTLFNIKIFFLDHNWNDNFLLECHWAGLNKFLDENKAPPFY